jgi:hypothetical protein
MYSILLKKLRNATLEKTFARVGKSIRTPCKVVIPPIIQKTIIGIVKGVFKLTFFRIRSTAQTVTVRATAKSSSLTYTQVWVTPTSGSFG